MKERARVVSAQEEFAQVKVDQKEEFCDSCSARTLCVGNKYKNGTITVLNSLSAKPGDEVKIEIPEGRYSKELILIFGVLLIASLLGMTVGYLSSLFSPFSSSQVSFIGFFIGLLSGGIFLYCYFRRNKKSKLYPVIINIIKKGDSHV